MSQHLHLHSFPTRRSSDLDDIEFGEAWEIVERDDLRVFDAIAAITRAVGFGDGFEDVEGDTIGAVADSVESQLKAGFVALEDRKSTRLNSSHVKISYAVFC